MQNCSTSLWEKPWHSNSFTVSTTISKFKHLIYPCRGAEPNDVAAEAHQAIFFFFLPADSPVDVKDDRTKKSSWSGTSGSGIRDTVAHVFSMLPIHLHSLSLKWPGKGYVKKTRNKKARGLWAAKAVRYIFWKESSEIYILAHFKFMHASDGTPRNQNIYANSIVPDP